MRTLKIGVRGSNSWVGEEVILFTKDSYHCQYSAVALKPCKILQIQKNTMLRRLPPEYLQLLINQAAERFAQNRERAQSIQKSFDKVSKTSSYSVVDRYNFNSKRKEHLDAQH